MPRFVYIVHYHNVIGGRGDLFDRQLSRLRAAEFARQVDFIVRRLRPMALPAMLDALRNGAPADDAIAFTFDDGFRGVLDHAFPILAERGIPAAVFVVTGRLEAPDDALFHFDELELAFRLTARRRTIRFKPLDWMLLPMATAIGRRWTLKRLKKRLKDLPEDARREWHARILGALDVSAEACRAHARSLDKFRTLTRDDLRTLIEAGWTVGSHTRTHRTLSRLSPDELRDEIAGSRDDLRRLLALRDIALAYPYGGAAHVSAEVRREAAGAGFTCGLTTIPGRNAAGGDPFALRRMTFKQLRKAIS